MVTFTEMMNTVTWVLNKVLEPIGLVVYGFVLFVIITSPCKCLRKPFFVFVVTSGTFGCISVFGLNIISILMGSHPTIEWIWLCYLMNILWTAGFYGHIIGLLIIALNRFQAFSANEEGVTGRNAWSNLQFRLLLGIQLIAPFLMCFYYYWAEFVFIADAEGVRRFTGVTSDWNLIGRAVEGLISAVYIVLSVALNAGALIRVHRLASNSTSQVERRMLYYTLCATGAELLHGALEVCWILSSILHSETLLWLVNVQVYWISDFSVFSSLIFLLLLSAQTRRAVLKALCISTKNTPNQSVITTNSIVVSPSSLAARR